MSSPYTQQVLKVIVAQVCQTIGWNSIQTTPLELLGDILHKYLQEVSHQTHRYSELYGRSEPNLDDVALAFRDMNIVIPDLEEYVTNVDPVPCAIDVPKYPHQKENRLNFLKPGCKEVVTRPVHVNEYLPPMYPEKEEEEKPNADALDLPNVQNGEMTPTLKDENDTFSSPEPSEASRLRTLSETEVRLTREITSVMMTTSGFISPAREGKLPDSKTPIIQTFDYPKPPPPKETPVIATATLPVVIEKSEKVDKQNKRKKPTEKKEKVAKDLFKSKVEPMGPPPPKQMPAMAEVIYPPSDSPMAAVVEQQQNQKRKSTSKSERKQKQKEGIKTPTKIAEGKPSKKKKKQAEKNLLAEENKQWDPIAMPGIAPLNNTSPLATSVGNDNYIKTERPLTPDIPKEMLLPYPSSQMSPLFNLPAGTTGTLTPAGPSPTPSPPSMVPSMYPYDGKLASEPDKRKMNIFKRISSSAKNKEELVKSMLPHNLNLPETSIFPIDDDPINYQQDPYTPTPNKRNNASPRKQNSSHLVMNSSDQPLNMSIPKQLQVTPEPMMPFDLTMSPGPSNQTFDPTMQFMPIDPTVKPKKEPKPKKVREKKPPKVREKKNKAAVPEWPKNIVPDLMVTSGSPTSIMSPPIRSMAPKKVAHLPPTLGNIDDEAMFNQFGHGFQMPWFAGANPGLIPGGPGGPGLIPNAPFFPPFPMHRPPFGPGGCAMNDMTPFGMPNANLMPDFPLLKRARIDDDQFSLTANMPIEVEKVKCNVASLVPASLKLDDDLEIVPSTPKSTKSKPSTVTQTNSKQMMSPPIKNSTKEQPSMQAVEQKDLSMVTDIGQPTQKRRRSTFSPPKTPVIIDLDVQSISDDELPDDMDIEEIQPSGEPAPVQSNLILPVTEKKDKSSLKMDKKKEKEHRKKDKEGKIKKKKDKKDKAKSKEKSEKRKEKEDKKRDKEIKDKIKKEKREKKREKERLAALGAAEDVHSGLVGTAAGFESVARLGFGGDLGSDSIVSNNDSEGSVPKLTLKLGQSPRPNTPDNHRKISIKHPKKERLGEPKSTDSDYVREPSPELARFSALVTRPPKQKTPSTKKKDEDKSLLDSLSPISSSDTSFGSVSAVSIAPPSTATATLPLSISPGTPSLICNKTTSQPTPGRGRPKISPTNSNSTSLTTIAPDGVNSVAPGSVVAESGIQNGICQPMGPFSSGTIQSQRKMNPPKIGEIKMPKVKSSKTSGNDKPGTGSASATGVQDSEGNQVWICPACGRVDDGTPMIGCDGCDAWYHWVCVGIQVPPDTNEDWYCRVCIAKKQEQAGSDKKKKRKKKDKKDH